MHKCARAMQLCWANEMMICSWCSQLNMGIICSWCHHGDEMRWWWCVCRCFDLRPQCGTQKKLGVRKHTFAWRTFPLLLPSLCTFHPIWVSISTFLLIRWLSMMSTSWCNSFIFNALAHHFLLDSSTQPWCLWHDFAAFLLDFNVILTLFLS